MKSIPTLLWCLLLTLLGTSTPGYAATGGVQVKLELVFGTQNNFAKVGVFAFGAAGQGLAVEAGLGVWAYGYLERFGAKQSNWSLGYEAFAIGGFGNNENLLGSSVSYYQTDGFFRRGNRRGFFGVGIGASRDVPLGTLRKFGGHRGHLLLRVADDSYSTHLNFANDFRIGPLLGAGLDQGQTASLRLGFTRIHDNRLEQLGIGFDVFTPQPDYSRAPSNPVNSEEGAKRSWFTTRPWPNLFHANLYLVASVQENNRVLAAKVGIDSPKLGAHVQNTIHDGFGLYPRYPWPIDKADSAYLEFSVVGGDLR